MVNNQDDITKAVDDIAKQRAADATAKSQAEKDAFVKAVNEELSTANQQRLRLQILDPSQGLGEPGISISYNNRGGTFTYDTVRQVWHSTDGQLTVPKGGLYDALVNLLAG